MSEPTCQAQGSPLERVVRFFWPPVCKHAVYFDDLHRVSETLVVATCDRCGKEFRATHGLALPVEWLGRRPEKPTDFEIMLAQNQIAKFLRWRRRGGENAPPATETRTRPSLK